MTTAVGIGADASGRSDDCAGLTKALRLRALLASSRRCACGAHELVARARLLVAVRVAIPLAACAARGSKLPGILRFTRFARDGGLMGDATGFYDATREFMAAWGRMPRRLCSSSLVLAAATAIVLAWRRHPSLRPWLPAWRWAPSGSPSASTSTG